MHREKELSTFTQEIIYDGMRLSLNMSDQKPFNPKDLYQL